MVKKANKGKTHEKNQTISEYFKLNKTQYDLDFFDAYLDRDTALFIDPWAIKCGDDEFSVSCYQKINSVFERLLYYIKSKDKSSAIDLLDNLHEPRETGLGYSKNTTAGSSVGPEKSEAIYNALLKSKAVKSGLLVDLEDTALHIEKIDRDNVSDIVTNIIRLDLIKYTQEQCEIYGIPTIEAQTRVYWDESKKDFVQSKEKLLIIDGKRRLLVPKNILRRKLLVNYSDFYAKGIVEFEQARHYDARTSLCRTLKIKKGKKTITIIKKPWKKTIEDDPRYTLSRGLVFTYIDKHPEILDKYKREKSTTELNPVGNKSILAKQNKTDSLEPSVEAKIEKFIKILPGTKYANDYHEHILDCLNTIFSEPANRNYLSGPKKEDRINSGRKRIDIIYHNSSNGGFFSRLSNYGNLICAKILFECKNYTNDLENTEYDQMVGRFNNRTSTIGYIVCRNIKDRAKALETCKDFITNGRGYIMILTDEDIIHLLGATLERDRDDIIDAFLQQKINEVAL